MADMKITNVAITTEAQDDLMLYICQTENDEKVFRKISPEDAGIPTGGDIPTALSDLTDDADHRTVTDAEKASWNEKQPAGNYASASHTHVKADITDFPTLSAVATSGSYNDLKNTPAIPTVSNDFTDEYKSHVDTLWEDYEAAVEVI